MLPSVASSTLTEISGAKPVNCELLTRNLCLFSRPPLSGFLITLPAYAAPADLEQEAKVGESCLEPLSVESERGCRVYCLRNPGHYDGAACGGATNKSKSDLSIVSHFSESMNGAGSESKRSKK